MYRVCRIVDVIRSRVLDGMRGDVMCSDVMILGVAVDVMEGLVVVNLVQSLYDYIPEPNTHVCADHVHQTESSHGLKLIDAHLKRKTEMSKQNN